MEEGVWESTPRVGQSREQMTNDGATETQMMKIGNLEARRGEKVYGALEGPQTHGGFQVDVPMHIVAGANEGATLVVQAGLSGLEIEPAIILPHVVKELDP